MGLIKEILERFQSRQMRFYEMLPRSGREKLAEAENKYAELRITGPEGGTFYFHYKGGHLDLLPEKPQVDDAKLDKLLLDGDGINYMGGDDVFLDVVSGSLSPRAVRSHHYFRANTDRIIYDSEEFAQAIETFLEEMRRVLAG